MEMADEKQEIEEAMAEQEPNNELKKQIEQRRRDNWKNLTDNLNKNIEGVADADLRYLPTPKQNIVNPIEHPDDTRGNEMESNVQELNAETEQITQINDIHEIPE